MRNLIIFDGVLMRGETAHWKITGTTFLEVVRTAPIYRLYTIGDRYPAMLRDDVHGISIRVELYHVPDHLWSHIRSIVPAGLLLRSIELADGRMVAGLLGEPDFVAHYGRDITSFGGWVTYPYRDPSLSTDTDPDVPAFELFVNGTLMRGLELHGNLRESPFLGAARTEPCYRIHAINDVHPGMYRLEDTEAGGISVPGELYWIVEELWPEVEAGEPPHLYRGRVWLEDGREVWGILYPRELAEGRHLDISDLGGWRAYIASKAASFKGRI